MREILFRGKRIDNGEWIFGDLRHWRNGSVGIHGNKLSNTLPVGPDTVGQYTGLDDKNGKRIFEGDIVRDNKEKIGYIVFLQQEAGWVIVWKGHDSRMGHRTRNCHYYADFTLEVIGNIHDNLELVKGGIAD